MKSIVSSLEILEARIAPALLATLTITNNGHTAHYKDVDHDLVTITTTGGSGVFLPAMFATDLPALMGETLQLLDLSGGAFAGENLIFSVIQFTGNSAVPPGNGLAHVGFIDSTGHNLGNVTVKGDLAQIDAGSGVGSAPAVASLKVNSLGRFGTDTQAAGSPSLKSDIVGRLGSLTVAHDVAGAFINVTGTNGTIGPIVIHGSLIGNAATQTGNISSSGDMGTVTIDHNVEGGSSGSDSGYIHSLGKIGTVKIGGSLLGNAGLNSGTIVSGGDMGAVMVGQNVQGGSGFFSGVIYSAGKITSAHVFGSVIGGSLGSPSAPVSNGGIWSFGDMGKVMIGHDVQGGIGCGSGVIFSSAKLAVVGGVGIGGSLIGGTACNSGSIISLGDMGMVKIGHDITSGSLDSAALGELCKSGYIESLNGRIAGVKVSGSIVSGIDANATFAIEESASIRAADDLGSLMVGGSLTGHADTGTGATLVVISARGHHVQTATDLAIGPITIGGRVEFAQILAGYKTDLSAVNADAQIGAVKVSGDWVASTLVAGAMNTASLNTKFGDANDATITGGTDAALIHSKIASIKILGQLYGTPVSLSGTDQFGFVAEKIGSLQIGGLPIAIPTDNTPLAIGETADVGSHIIP